MLLHTLCFVAIGYQIWLIFCGTDPFFEGSAMENETDLLTPMMSTERVCVDKLFEVDRNTLFFVLNDAILPDIEHDVTFTVSASYSSIVCHTF